MHLQALFENSIVQRLISRTAWEALRSSNAFSSVDYDTMLALSELYALQEVGVESTLKRILEILSSREAMEPGELRYTVQLLRNGFRELVSQEDYLLHKYEAAIGVLVK